MIIQSKSNIGDKVEIETINGKKTVEIVKMELKYICKTDNGKQIVLNAKDIEG